MVRALAAFGCVALAAWLFRSPLLTAIAQAWVVDDPVTKADAIVVLGGGYKYRPLAAARLYKQDYAPKVLIMEVDLHSSPQAPAKEPKRDLTWNLLIQQGVPEKAIEAVGWPVKSTYHESLAVRDWARENHARSLLITTELFHTRRAKWLFTKQFRGTGTDIRVVAAERPEYQTTNWWQKMQGFLAFQSELVKLPYYWLRY